MARLFGGGVLFTSLAAGKLHDAKRDLAPSVIGLIIDTDFVSYEYSARWSRQLKLFRTNVRL